jgi:hypothetical protein
MRLHLVLALLGVLGSVLALCGTDEVAVAQTLVLGAPATPVTVSEVDAFVIAVAVPAHTPSILLEVLGAPDCAASADVIIHIVTGEGSDTCIPADSWDATKSESIYCDRTSLFPLLAFYIPVDFDADEATFLDFSIRAKPHYADSPKQVPLLIRVTDPPMLGTNLAPTQLPLVPSSAKWDESPTWYRIPSTDEYLAALETDGTIPLAVVAPVPDSDLSLPFLAVRADCDGQAPPPLNIGSFNLPRAESEVHYLYTAGELDQLPLPILETETGLMATGTISMRYADPHYERLLVVSSGCYISLDAVGTPGAPVFTLPYNTPIDETGAVYVSAADEHAACGDKSAPAAVFELVVADPADPASNPVQNPNAAPAALDRVIVRPLLVAGEMTDEFSIMTQIHRMDSGGVTFDADMPSQCTAFNFGADPTLLWPLSQPCYGNIDPAVGDGGVVLFAPQPGRYLVSLTIYANDGLCPLDMKLGLRVQTLVHDVTVLGDEALEAMLTPGASLDIPVAFSGDNLEMQTFIFPYSDHAMPWSLAFVPNTTHNVIASTLNACVDILAAGDPEALLADQALLETIVPRAPVCLNAASPVSETPAYAPLNLSLTAGLTVTLEDLVNHRYPLTPGLYAVTINNSPSTIGKKLLESTGTFQLISGGADDSLNFVQAASTDVIELSGSAMAVFPDLSFPPYTAATRGEMTARFYVTYDVSADPSADSRRVMLGVAAAASHTLTQYDSTSFAKLPEHTTMPLMQLEPATTGTLPSGTITLMDYPALHGLPFGTMFGAADLLASPRPYVTITRDAAQISAHPEVDLPLAGSVKVGYEVDCLVANNGDLDDDCSGYTTVTQYSPVCDCVFPLSGAGCAVIDLGTPLVPNGDAQKVLLYDNMSYATTVTLDATAPMTVLAHAVGVCSDTISTYTFKVTVFDNASGIPIEDQTATTDPFVSFQRGITAPFPIVFQAGLATAFPQGLRVVFTRTDSSKGGAAFSIRALLPLTSCPDNCSGHGNCVFDPDTAQSNCACFAGYVLGADDDCSGSCPSGTETLDGVVCTPCTPGSAGTAGFCFACPKNTIPSTDRVNCEDCPAGMVTDGPNSSECHTLVCDAGYAPDGINCVPCGPGYTSNGTTCTICPAGTFGPNDANEQCWPCNQGQPPGSTECTDCPAGFQIINAGTACVACPAGSFSAAPNSTECTLCDPGSASGAPGAVACEVCLPGAYAAAPGRTQCALCPAGDYQPDSGGIACLVCPPGEYEPSPGAAGCNACTAGYFAPDQGDQECTACPAGTASAPGAAKCNACDPGTFSAAEASTTCDKCPAGTFQPKSGSSACLACPAGQWSNSGAQRCTLCAAGTFSAANATACTPCPVGTFSALAGASTCQNCASGTFASQVGSSQCQNCAAGTSAAVGSSLCQACAAGSFSTTGAPVCSPCDAGTYSSLPGAEKCLPCAAGSAAPGIGATVCTPCTPGTYAQTAGTKTCLLCAPGRYNNRQGALACSFCPAGTMAPNAGSTSCAVCPIGAFAAGGSSTCDLCPPGSYSSVTGSPACTKCTAGSAASKPGSISCDNCAAGEFAPDIGATICELCPPETYSPVAGTVSCSACTHTLWSGVASPGSTKCPLSGAKITFTVVLGVLLVGSAIAAAVIVGRREGHRSAHASARAPLLQVDQLQETDL